MYAFNVPFAHFGTKRVALYGNVTIFVFEILHFFLTVADFQVENDDFSQSGELNLLNPSKYCTFI